MEPPLEALLDFAERNWLYSPWDAGIALALGGRFIAAQLCAEHLAQVGDHQGAGLIYALLEMGGEAIKQAWRYIHRGGNALAAGKICALAGEMEKANEYCRAALEKGQMLEAAMILAWMKDPKALEAAKLLGEEGKYLEAAQLCLILSEPDTALDYLSQELYRRGPLLPIQDQRRFHACLLIWLSGYAEFSAKYAERIEDIQWQKRMLAITGEIMEFRDEASSPDERMFHEGMVWAYARRPAEVMEGAGALLFDGKIQEGLHLVATFFKCRSPYFWDDTNVW